jgi:hypothetical protein
VIVQMLFGEGYVFQRHRGFAALEFNKFIDPNPTHDCFQCKQLSAEGPLSTPADSKNRF